MTPTAFTGAGKLKARVRQYERFVQFLARHKSARAVLAWLCHTDLADRIVARVAGRIAKSHPKGAVDYENWVQAYISARQHYQSFVREDIDAEFVTAIMDEPENHTKLVRFLQGLDTLEPEVRTGLIKTWIHTAILNMIIRKARFLSDRQEGAGRPYLMDAMIAPFGRCSLRCRGCYAFGELNGRSATVGQLDYLIRQVKCHNVYHVLLVGKGEPFCDEESKRVLFEIAGRHPQVFFSVYSNGTNITAEDILKVKALPNVLLLLSIDGPEPVNDWRRGEGVYQKVTQTLRLMQKHGLFFGYISTVFNQNYAEVLDPAFAERMADLGCRIAYYSLFLPFGEESCQDMMLSSMKRQEYAGRFRELKAAAPIPMIDIDSVEQGFGCRAKRGATVYIDGITGRVSPCVRMPFSPQSCNIYRPAGPERLSEILETDFFRNYRGSSPECGTCADSLGAELSRFCSCTALPTAQRDRAKDYLDRCRW